MNPSSMTNSSLLLLLSFALHSSMSVSICSDTSIVTVDELLGILLGQNLILFLLDFFEFLFDDFDELVKSHKC